MKVEVFSKGQCPHCDRAKALLTQRGIAYEEISAVENRDALIERVTALTGKPPKTVPQIFIDDQHIGGADELTEWLKAN